uniref:Uncharacterized protein n=1 Tax=Anguilla anguilla TaxID=7936 RepID=A0A0E9PYN8_ANGAN
MVVGELTCTHSVWSDNPKCIGTPPYGSPSNLNRG